jgi:hypothetical protein
VSGLTCCSQRRDEHSEGDALRTPNDRLLANGVLDLAEYLLDLPGDLLVRALGFQRGILSVFPSERSLQGHVVASADQIAIGLDRQCIEKLMHSRVKA